MAKLQSHFSCSTGLAILYALFGIMVFNATLEIVLLASVIVVFAGVLPNIDEGKGGPAQEFAGLLAAVAPLVLFSFYPSFRAGGISRVALVVIGCYLVSRVVIVRLLQGLTVHRGVLHSIPAAVITFEIVFLLFGDLFMRERLYLSMAAFIGFMGHLVMDAYGNLDLVGRAMGRGVEKQPGALKLFGNTWGSTFAMYTCMLVLGWYVMKDIYPGFHFVAGVKY